MLGLILLLPTLAVAFSSGGGQFSLVAPLDVVALVGLTPKVSASHPQVTLEKVKPAMRSACAREECALKE